MKIGRWVYLAALVLFPWGVWWLAARAGHPVSTWHLPGVSRPEWLYLYWAFSWDLLTFSPIMELRGPVFSAAEEVGRWMLYTMLVTTLSGLFLAWGWGALLLERLVVTLIPFLHVLAIPLVVAFYLLLLSWTWKGVEWAMVYDIGAPFRHFVRYRLLLLSTSTEEIVHLMDEVSLPEEVKQAYRERLQKDPSPETLRALWEEVKRLPPAESLAEKTARARLFQAIFNRLDEAALDREG